MQEIAESLPITEGVDRLMYVLKKYGYKIAILSGGFTYFGQYLQKKYGIDYVYANELKIVDGKLTGRYLGDVVDGKRKAELLRLIAQVEKVDIAQTIAVGDGAKRSADVRNCRTRHCISCQTQSCGKCQAIH